MKSIRHLTRILAIAGALAISLSLASCDLLKKGGDTTSSEPAAVSSQEPEQTQLEKLVSDDTFQQQVQSMSASYEAQGIKMTVTAEGNSLIYTCTYTKDIEDKDAAKEKLQQYLDGSTMTASFQSILKSVQVSVPEAESVVVKYLDKDGELLVSKEYK